MLGHCKSTHGRRAEASTWKAGRHWLTSGFSSTRLLAFTRTRPEPWTMNPEPWTMNHPPGFGQDEHRPSLSRVATLLGVVRPVLFIVCSCPVAVNTTVALLNSNYSHVSVPKFLSFNRDFLLVLPHCWLSVHQLWSQQPTAASQPTYRKRGKLPKSKICRLNTAVAVGHLKRCHVINLHIVRSSLRRSPLSDRTIELLTSE